VRIWILLGAVVLSLGAGACGAAGSSPKPPSGPGMTIGSSGTTEQAIVANLYAAVLEHAGARVTLHTASRTGLSTRALLEPALTAGRVDLYPDEAGALLLSLDANDTAAATAAVTAVPELKRLLSVSGATVLDPAPALDTEVFAVTRATADLYHLTTLSSVAPVANKLVLGGPPGCPTKPQCQAGLQSTYGLHFKSFTSLDDAGPITVAALRGGEVQMATLHSSDGSVIENNFVALDDDKHLLNADNVIPVIRTSVDSPKVAAALNRLSARLTTDALARLTIEVTVDHQSPGAVARRWLGHDRLI
jgi:osmoprotectant transport system substrate-binding protein